MGKPLGQRNGGAGGRDKAVGSRQAAPNPNYSRARLPSGQQGPIVPGGKDGGAKIGRIETAIERQSYRNSFTPEQQLQRLDTRLGVGVGAKKERKRLLKLIQQRIDETLKEQAKPIEVPKSTVVVKSNSQSLRKGRK